jgi:hypothetical protein
MNRTTDRNLALDLATTNLSDQDELVAFLATHVLGPARALYHMPPAEPDEGTERLDRARSDYAAGGDSYYGLDVSTALFDRFIGPCVLFARLFPGALWNVNVLENTLSVPQWAYFDDSRDLAHFLWSDLQNLVAGLFGGPIDPVRHAGLAHIYRPARNDEGLAELRDARELAREVLRPVISLDDPTYRRRSTGLRVLDSQTTWTVDEVLRANAHQRLIWFADQDVAFPIAQTEFGPDGIVHLVPPDDPDKPIELIADHGVFATVVPETIAAVVALDLVSTFGRERHVGRCAHCQGLMLLSRSQVARAETGGEVYHSDCREIHRLAYFRSRARDRYARTRGTANGH